MKRFLNLACILFYSLTGYAFLFGQNAQKISPDGISYIDPEILSAENKLAFQMGNGQVWLSNLDPHTGHFISQTGLDLLIDSGATPLITSFNGPEFGVDSSGWCIVYTKPNGAVPQAWLATVNGMNVSKAPLTGGNVPRLSILASKSPDSPTTRILYGKGPSLSNGVFGWTDENDPANEVILDSTDNGVRWVDGLRQFFFIAQTGPAAGQVFHYDTETQSGVQVTNDADMKTYSYGWYAPEYNELVVMVLLNDTAIGIYKDQGGDYWDRIITIQVPPASSFDFIGSPETFVANGKSYISFVTKVIGTGSSYVNSEVWVVDINPDINDRFMLRCDDGSPDTRRTDPESYLGANEVFIYYNQINGSGEFEVWRYATGIPVSELTAQEREKKKSGGVSIYPNPASDFLYLKNWIGNSFEGAIFDLTGRLIKRVRDRNPVYIGDLGAGLYVLEVSGGGKGATLTFFKN